MFRLGLEESFRRVPAGLQVAFGKSSVLRGILLYRTASGPQATEAPLPGNKTEAAMPDKVKVDLTVFVTSVSK